jgi:hypothetical protein
MGQSSHSPDSDARANNKEWNVTRIPSRTVGRGAPSDTGATSMQQKRRRFIQSRTGQHARRAHGSQRTRRHESRAKRGFEKIA